MGVWKMKYLKEKTKWSRICWFRGLFWKWGKTPMNPTSKSMFVVKQFVWVNSFKPKTALCGKFLLLNRQSTFMGACIFINVTGVLYAPVFVLTAHFLRTLLMTHLYTITYASARPKPTVYAIFVFCLQDRQRQPFCANICTVWNDGILFILYINAW